MYKNKILFSALVWLCIMPTVTFAKKKEKTTKVIDKRFSIVTLGDMPYTLPEDYGRFENVIKTINEQDQVFNVFVGDIKASTTPCTEASYQKMYDYFNQFNKPLVYTPGDNEWTDCSKKEAGAYDPEERLAVVRKMFFKDSLSFGKTKMPMTHQSHSPAFSKFVENTYWSYNDVTFATIHIVGTNNFFLPDSKNHNQEFFERDSANIVWLQEVFSKAKTNQHIGVVLFVHGDMFGSNKGDNGFKNFLQELKKQVIEYGKPVLMVNGDSHEFKVDKPIQKMPKVKNALANFTRVQVFGENEMHAVKISINPNSTSLFQIEQLIVPGN